MSVSAAAPTGSSWLRIKAIVRRHALALRRSPHRVFDISIWPLVDVLTFGAIGAFVSGAGTEGARAFGYLCGGIVLWHVIYQAQIAVSTGFLEETWSRNLLNLMVTPLREIEFVAGVALFGLLKLAVGVGLVSLTALLFFSFDITDLGLGLIPIATILLLVGWSIALFVVGIVLRFGSGAEAITWGILFVLMPLSGAFYPIEALPGALHPIALALPTTHAFHAMRTLLDEGGIDWERLGAAAILTLLLALFAFAFLTKMLKLFRKRGYITRYS